MLKFKGCCHFRQRLILSTLSGKSIRIDDIRAQEQNPGLRDFEASLLRLLEKLTNGCLVEINETGTSLRYKPGVIICGGGLVHDCGTSRSIGYFLEALIILALFAKRPLSITLKGITNDHVDPSVDTWRTVTLPLIRRAAGLDDSSALECKIVKRGARPGGGGEVQLRVPLIKQLPRLDMTDEGMVKRIRGIAYSMRVPPQNANRMVDAARGVLNQLLADVYIFTDAASNAAAGASPGYGITLVAETTSGCLISAEAAATQGAGSAAAAGAAGVEDPLVVPEDIGRAAAQLLLDEVSRGGVTDGTHQALLLLLAALGPEEMNQVRLGPLTPYAVHTLRHTKEFFQVQFSMRTEQQSGTIFLSCIGAGLKNINRKVT